MVEVDQRNEWRQFSESPWISVEVALPHEMTEAEVLLQVLTSLPNSLCFTVSFCEPTACL